jgi:hypothetical protein
MPANVLASNPAPILEGLFADTPSSREIAELADMLSVVREREPMFSVVQVELRYLLLPLEHRYRIMEYRGTDLDADAIRQDLRFGPALGSGRKHHR